MGLRTRIFMAFATLILTALLLVPSASIAADSSIDEIYAALRPENLRTTTGGTTFSQGDSVELLFDLVNTSEEPLVIPLTDYFGRSFHLVGTEQSWIERLGPDPTIPSIPPIIGRKGTWYASGGAIIALEGLPENTIPPGGRVTRQASLLHPTGEFPSGRYRFHVEYKPLNGDLYDVIAGLSLDLTFGDVSAPAVLGHGRFNTEGNGQVIFTLSNEQVNFDRIRGQRFSFIGEVASVVGEEKAATLNGSGMWNGQSGYTFETSVVDKGGWGRLEDTINVVIRDPAGTIVFTSFGPQGLKQGDISVTPADSG